MEGRCDSLPAWKGGGLAMSVASWSGSLLAWERELTALKDRLGRCVRRRELRTSIGHYLDGLLSGVERKTGWLLAERAGEARPHRLQAVLGRGRWDADAARDRVRAYAVEALADRDAVLGVDETGFLKKGALRRRGAAVLRHSGADRE